MKKDILKAMLHFNVCMIEFKKDDGSIREAQATMSPAFITSTTGRFTGKPSTALINENKMDTGDTVTFFDIDLEEYRSFKINRLITINNIDWKGVFSTT